MNNFRRSSFRWRTPLLVGVLVFLSACQRQSLEPPAVARIGERVITRPEFEQAYAEYLLRSNTGDTRQARETVLNFLLEQAILAQEARKLSLDTAAAVKQAVRLAERAALVQETYQEWVRNRTPEPTEKVLRETYQRYQTPLLVRHLFARTRAAADSLYRLLSSGEKDFQQLARETFQDSLLRHNGGLLGWVRYGELDPALEQVAWRLPLGKPSQPVKSRYGWHILEVEARQRPVLLTESDYQLQRERIKRLWRRQQEQLLGDSVIAAYMERQHLQFNLPVARRVWRLIARRLAEITADPNAPLELSPTGLELGTVQDSLKPLLNQEMLRFDDTRWTVKDFLKRLPAMNRRLLTQNLPRGTAYLVRDELLAAEARRQGWDQRPRPQALVAQARDQALAQAYLSYRWGQKTFSNTALRNFYRRQWITRYMAPDSLYLQALLLPDSGAALKILTQLRRGANFDSLATLFPYPAPGRRKGKLGWQVQGRTPFPLLYQAAKNLPRGQVAGPIRTAQGYAIVRVLHRRRYPLPFAAIREKVKRDLEAEELRRFRLEILQELKPHYQAQVNWEELGGGK